MKCSIKSGDNLVIEFSAAAYELARTCIDKILSDELFPYGYEKRDSLDHNGAVTDLCYRIYNKKTDGSCGKKLKFTINLYHTTSQFLLNGSKVDLFLSDIYERLCSEMKACCNVLDIMNINIATAIKNGTSKAQLSDNEHGKKLNQVKELVEGIV